MHRDDRFSRSIQEPDPTSRRLNAGCRPGSFQVCSRACPGRSVHPRFRHQLRRFDTSSTVRLRSPLRIIPAEISFRLSCNAAESARGVSPRAAHRSGLDTLASSGSCHRTKAAASRQELELLLLPVGSLPTSVTCPLRSTGITPLPRYYGAVRPCPPHRYFRPRSFAACTFSLGIAGQVLKFRTRARTRVMPPIHRAPRGQ